MKETLTDVNGILGSAVNTLGGLIQQLLGGLNLGGILGGQGGSLPLGL